MKGTRRAKPISEIAVEKCGFYLPDHARYDYLLNLPEEEEIDQKMKKAMEAIEEYKPELKGILPQDEYFRLTRTDKTGKVMYTPPENEQTILDLLTNLEAYINTETEALHPLIKLAIIQYQFESIHPFYDGNGRTGRIINVLYLVMKGLLSEPLLYLSRYIIRHKADYYGLLRKVTAENAWEEWICFLPTAVEKTAGYTLTLSKEIVSLMENVRKSMQNKIPKIYLHELVETLFTNVYTRISSSTSGSRTTRTSASSSSTGSLIGSGIRSNRKRNQK